MKELIQTLLPYCKQHNLKYFIGFFCIAFTNLLYVGAMVLMARTIDFLVGPDFSLNGLLKLLMLMLTMVGVGAVAQYFQRMLVIATSRDIEYSFRNDFFKHLTHLNPNFYDHSKTGDIISRATTDIEQVRMALGPGIMYPVNTFTSVPMTLVPMFLFSWPITLCCFVPLLLLPRLVRYLANAMYKRSLKLQEHYSTFSARIQESITGIRVIKSFVQDERELSALDVMSKEYAKLNMRMAVIQAMFFPVMLLLFGVGSIIIIWVGSYYIVPDSSTVAAQYLTKGELVAFTILYGNLFFPIIGLGWVMSIYQRASASMHRIQLILKQKPEIQDSAETDFSLTEVRGEIEFRNLTFRYPDAQEPALDDISLTIPAGKTLGIIGAVGSGKSTLGRLITRLYDVPKGMMFVDGHDIRRYPLGVLRESIGVVFQETYLFSDTILENICFGMPDGADAQKAQDAARRADVANDIDEFPEGYQTMLGERGINLSGGQKQRISLARALACDPPILILDDAFSAVDTNTEERILQGIDEVLHDRTAILISHRISTISNADQIIVLDAGRVVESGTHAELIARGGMYADIHYRQQLEEAIQEEV